MPNRYLIGDTETSGLKANAKAVELAWIETDKDLNRLAQWHSRIDPEIPIDPAASGIHGITNAMVEDEPTLEEFIEHRLGGPLTGDCVLVAHNAQFDMRFFPPLCENLWASVDTLKLSRKLWPDLENHKIQTLRYEFELEARMRELMDEYGIEAAMAHSAMGDVLVLIALVERIQAETDWDLDQMLEVQKAPLLQKTCRFGKKHYGKTWAQVVEEDRGYLEWIQREVSDLDPDTAHTVAHYLRQKE